MKTIPKWMAATLTLALTASLSIISTLAVSAAESFADFRIDASAMDAPDRTISLDWYRRGEDGSFHPADVAADYDYTLNRKINRVTGDATFYIQPKTDGVWVTVDYLTDVNGDGFYELLEGGDDPVWDTLTAQGRLTQGGKENLTVAQTYILSAETLTKRFDETERARAQLLALNIITKVRL